MIILDHIAILTESLAKTESALPGNLKRDEIETFPAEGTKEQYISLRDNTGPFILLLEAIGEGPYQNTLEKRGAGLHHFGCHTDDLNKAVDFFHGKGLLMHPYSLKSLEINTVWLCRPGIPFLVELVQTDHPIKEAGPTIRMALPTLEQQIDWVPGLELAPPATGEISLAIGSIKFEIEL